jgi:hypothetical protein
LVTWFFPGHLPQSYAKAVENLTSRRAAPKGAGANYRVLAPTGVDPVTFRFSVVPGGI